MQDLKHKIVLLSFIGMYVNVQSQNLYFSVDAGYAMGVNQETGWLRNWEYASYLDFASGDGWLKQSTENVPLSLGKGFNFGGSIGYLVNPHFGFELGLSYNIGSKTTGTNTRIVTSTNFQGFENRSEEVTTVTMSSNMFRIAPSVIITPGFEKFNPYLKLGVMFGFGSVIEARERNYKDNGTPPVTTSEFYQNVYDGGYSFGLNAALGGEYWLNETMSVFCDLRYLGATYTPTKRTLTEFKINGEDKLPGTTVNYRETNYVDFVPADAATDQDSPRTKLKITMPFSSLGLNFGIKYSIK